MSKNTDEITNNPATGLGAFGTIMSAIGSMVSAGTAVSTGNAQRTAANFTATQQNAAAQSTMAAGERSAANETLKAQLLASRAMAVAGAGGGDASSPGVTHVIADITGRGAYNAGVAMYDAEDKARELNLQADATRYAGGVAQQGGQQKAAAYMFGSAGNLAQSASLFSKYGGGGPKASNGPISPTLDWNQ